MVDGWLNSILNEYSSTVIKQMHTIICDVNNCDKQSVTAENIYDYLLKHKEMFIPLCPFCGRVVRFVFYTDSRTGFLCDGCKASGANYCGSF